MTPALQSIQDAAGRLPDKMSADNGYMSGGNLEAFKTIPVDVHIATDKGEKTSKTPLDESDRKLVKADFDYDEEKECFTCPEGQELRLRCQTKDGKKTYQGDSGVCTDCLYKSRCCQSSKGEARTIQTDDKEPLRQQMNVKMEKEESKALYKKRKVIVEPVFGHIKNSGFRRFSVR